MSIERPDPSAIMQLTTGYWASATLLAANRIGLFGALAGEAKSAASVASALGTDLRATEMVLDACTGLGLLQKTTDADESVYGNAPAAAAFLVPGSPAYLGSALQWADDQYAAWGKLAQSVQTGQPAVAPEQHLGADPVQTRAFVLGMHQRAAGIARGVVPFLDMTGVKNLLDVGGGPGTYACLLAQQNPDLQVTVLDLDAIVAIASELIAQAGMSARVQTRAGDATSGDYGAAAYDAVLFSGVLHQMSPATIQKMFSGARQALRPGGKVLICDIMTDGTKAQPPFATLFSLQMLLTSAEGAVFSSAECVSWLEASGFDNITVRPLPPPLPYTLAQGTIL